MRKLHIILLTYGILTLKSVNEDLTDEELEQLSQARSVIRHILICTLLTAITILLLIRGL